MSRLSLQDTAWLAIERDKTPMHIGGLSLFRLPDGAEASFVREVFDRHRNAGPLRPPFDQSLQWPRLKLGLPQLKPDREVDIDYHLRHSALPVGGSYRDLFILVSRLHSIPLDLQRPLWEFHVIEGLPDRQYATYIKIHHALADGTAGVRMLNGSLSPDPQCVDMPPVWSKTADRIGRLHDEPVCQRTARAPEGHLRVLPELWRVGVEMLSVAAGRKLSPLRTPWQAPRSLLNGPLSGARRVVCQSWPQERLHAAAKALSITLNDLVLAMCSGALRTYLISQNALPDRPLICGVPVAISRGEGESLGNSISMAFANLGTDRADPSARVATITHSIRAAKELLSTLSRDSLLGYTMMVTAPLAVEQLAVLAGVAPPVFNLIISNVPGPKTTMYWNGARLEHVYPISLLPDGQALNISLLSYAGSLDVSLVACRRTLPHMQRLIDYLEDALVELEQLAATRAGRRVRKSAARSLA